MIADIAKDKQVQEEEFKKGAGGLFVRCDLPITTAFAVGIIMGFGIMTGTIDGRMVHDHG